MSRGKRYTDEQRNHALELWMSGKFATYKELAIHLEMNPSTLENWASKWKATKRENRRKQEEIKEKAHESVRKKKIVDAKIIYEEMYNTNTAQHRLVSNETAKFIEKRSSGGEASISELRTLVSIQAQVIQNHHLLIGKPTENVNSNVNIVQPLEQVVLIGKGKNDRD